MASSINFNTPSSASNSHSTDQTRAALFGELNELEKQKQIAKNCLVSLKNGASQNKTLLSQKKGQLEEINNEIISLSKFAKDKEACEKKINSAQIRKKECEDACSKFEQEISTFDNEINSQVNAVINTISLQIINVNNRIQRSNPLLQAIVISNNNTNSRNAAPIDLIHLSNTAIQLQHSSRQTPNTSNHSNNNTNHIDTDPIDQSKSSKRKENPNLNDISIDLAEDEENLNSSNAAPTQETQNEKFPPRKMTALQKRLKEIITTSQPKSDRDLSLILQNEKFDCNKYIVKSNRQKLGLPNSKGRKSGEPELAIQECLKQIIIHEKHRKPFTDPELVVQLKKIGDYTVARHKVCTMRAVLGYPTSGERYEFYHSNSNSQTDASSDSDSTISEVTINPKTVEERRQYLKQLIDTENHPYNDIALSDLLREEGYLCSDTTVTKDRNYLGIGNAKQRSNNNNSTSSNHNASMDLNQN